MRSKVDLKAVLLLGFLLLLGWSSRAQSPTQWSKLAKQAEAEGDIYATVFYYKKAAEADSLNLNMWMRYGDALRFSNDYKRAGEVYKYVFEHPQFSADQNVSLYWLAKMQQYQGQYQDADVNFQSYVNYYSESGSFLRADANQQRKSVEWALLHIGDTLDPGIQNLGLNSNSNYADFGGTLLNDTTLIFSSLRYIKKDSSLEIHRSEIGNRVKLLKGVRRDSLWISIEEMDSVLIRTDKHIANATYYADSAWLLFSECGDYGNCKIYYSPYNGEYFEDAVAFPDNINLDGFNTTQPFMATITGVPVLFFSTNRPQGKGGLDLWYSMYKPRLNTWGYPRNLGRNINTKGNEITPFFNSDSNLLFFSSDWHEGFGGFDVFESRANSLRSFRTPVNMGLGINSSLNDLYFAEFPEDSIAIFSSNREGGMKMEGQTCCNDVYYYKIEAPIEVIEDTVVPDTPTAPILVTLEEINEYLPVLYFHNDQPNPRTTKTTTKKSYYDCFHEYLDLRPEYLKEYSKNKKGADRDTAINRIKHFYTEKVEKGMNDFDQFCSLLLDRLEKGDSAVVTIKGYSSRLASSDYNLNLTKRRIESLINYMDHYKDGILKPYLPRNESDSAAIVFEKIPFGESKAKHTTSDDLNDKINSVYSPDAMLERRIEILHVSKQEHKRTLED